MNGSTTKGYDALMQGWTMITDAEEQGLVSSEPRDNFQPSNVTPSVDTNAFVAVFGEPFAPLGAGPTEQKAAKEKKSKEKKSKTKDKKSKDTKKKHKERKTSRPSSEEPLTFDEERWNLHEARGTETALQSSEMVSHTRSNSSRVNFDLRDPAVSTLSALHEEGRHQDVWSDEDALMHPSRHVPATARGRLAYMGDSQLKQASGFEHGGVAFGSGLQSFAGDNESELTPDVYSERLRQDLGSDYEDDVSLELLVGYMMSMGADQEVAEQLAIRFAAEQERAGRSLSYVTTDKTMEVKQTGNNNRWTGSEDPDTSNTSPLSFSQSSFRASRYEAQVVQATPVKDSEADWPIVYADTTTIGIKHLLQERPIRRLVCVALVFFLAGIVSLILFLTVFKTTETARVTNAPTMTPSQSPTFLSDDLVAAASFLSRPEKLEDRSSPQFRAVGWMSSFDTIDTSGLGLAFAQRYALVVMYFSLGGEGWTNQEKWLDPSLHECDWSSGIFCLYDVSERRVVTGFDATRNNLQGSIPDEIGLLTSSETFRIPKNKVGGTLPSTFGRMTSLSVIDCSENEIEGSIPSTINGVSNLIQLDLSSNKLNSTIPNELYSLPLLRTLAVRSNHLSGPLDETISGLQSLVTLDVRNNSLSGPLPLSFDGFPALDIVWLDYNQFTGMLPNITNGFTRKQVLSLSHNNFFGNAQLSPDFNFTSLLAGEDNRVQHIDISYNRLSGPISNTFFYLPNLKHFDLSGNFFTGTFRSDIAWLGIEFLAASNNELTGTIPTGYPTLTHLDMSSNQFTQGIPTDICQYPDLQFLIVSGNSLGSTLPSCLGSIPKLRGLEVSGSRLTGAIPTLFGQLDMLEVLNLSGNSLTGSIPLEVGTMVALKDLYLEQNQLSGTIPSELSNLTSLRNLDLSDNLMTGSIPAWSGTFTDLESIVLVDNAFVGEIPTALCAATNLELTLRDIGCGIDCSCCGDSDVCG